MLQHEQADPPAVAPTIPLPVSSAAEARVTPDELNAALKALEDRQSSTVAIGSVVDELRLNATPEQIWEQVQKQRAQKQGPKPVAVYSGQRPSAAGVCEPGATSKAGSGCCSGAAVDWAGRRCPLCCITVYQ